jgi:hypothetical protein
MSGSAGQSQHTVATIADALRRNSTADFSGGNLCRRPDVLPSVGPQFQFKGIHRRADNGSSRVLFHILPVLVHPPCVCRVGFSFREGIAVNEGLPMFPSELRLALQRHFVKRWQGARRLRRFTTKSAGESLHPPVLFGCFTLKRPEGRAPDTRSVAVVLSRGPTSHIE